MAEITYAGWNMFDKVTIVERTGGYHRDWSGNWKLGVAELPQGYVCDSNNKKMLEAALSWARWCEYPKDENGKYIYEAKIEHEGICHQLDNSGFILELLEPAQDSSQGGKLSFWNCRITHGERSWKIGIAADLLLDVLKNTTFVNGVCQEPLFFARKSGRVGMLCKSMDAYAQAQKDQARKATMSSGKTKKYVEGNTYETLTMKDAYLGYFWQHYTWKEEYTYGYFRRNNVKEIIKLDKPQKVYWLPSYDEAKTARSHYSLNGWSLQNSCPARKVGEETIELDKPLKEIIDERHKFLTDLDKNAEKVHVYLDTTWFINTDPDNWEWPEGMKDMLIKDGWTIQE